MNKTKNLSCRVTAELISQVDRAAADLNLCRSEWLELAIARQLGKRPRVSINTRLNKLEKQVAALTAAQSPANEKPAAERATG